MERKTLTLKKPPDPAKIAQSLQIGFRFVDRKGRYILQKLETVRYEPRVVLANTDCGLLSIVQKTVVETTWIDIPLVPENYGASA